MTKVGILAIQGSIQEHCRAIREAGAEPVLVKTAAQLDEVNGLILPGGESTTIGMLLRRFNLRDAIQKKAHDGMPLYGTCAGAILLAKKINGTEKADSLQLANVTIERNAYGHQADSFVTEVDLTEPLPEKTIPAVFIRAPRIAAVGSKVQIISHDGNDITCALDGNILVSTFHPELTTDRTIHIFFIKQCKKYAEKRSHRALNSATY